MATSSDSSRLRILHVVDSLEYGGLERVVTDLAIGQRGAGDDVRVFSIKDVGELAGELEAAGVPVTWGGKQRGPSLRTIRRLRSAALDGPVDVVHAHNFMPSYYSAASLFLRRKGPALVATCHDMGTRLNQRKLRWMFRWSLSHTARVAMVGGQVYDRYMQMNMVRPEVTITVLNGIPVERFGVSDERRERARDALVVPRSALVIGTVGRQVALKNQRLILELLPGLAQSHPELRVVLIGDGVLRGTLEKQASELRISERVHFAGERKDVADLLPAFDVFVLPSLTEGLSIALLEAAASGLAIVASRVGGNPEIIQDGTTGLLVAPADPVALRDALLRLLDDSTLRLRFGVAARDWVQANASLNAMRLAYDEFYRKALASQLAAGRS
ncbi:MAG: glycosyltransferase [Burkholderiaceae bacterium]